MTFDVYTRVSKLGERSEDNLRSPELQEAACRDWAARAGLEIGEVASDKNVSGSTAAEERKLGRLIEKMERGVRMSKTGNRALLANRAYVGEMEVQTARKGATRTVRGTWTTLVTEGE